MTAKNGNHKNRGAALPVLLAGSALLSAWVYWGNVSVQTTRVTVRSEKIPGPFAGFTVAQVSDLHNAQFGPGQRRLLAAIRAVRPDVIAVTGDLIDSRRTNIQKAMEFIRGAASIAPVYYVTGNHEARMFLHKTHAAACEALKSQLEAAGAVTLDDRAVTLSRGGASIRLVGLACPPYARNTEHIGAKLRGLLGRDDGYSILLSHRPAMFDIYAAAGVDLALCGHVHGGQVRIPFVGGLLNPDIGFFPKYSAGLYEQGGTQMVVSRGLGNSKLPVRVNDRPELVAVTLV